MDNNPPTRVAFVDETGEVAVSITIDDSRFFERYNREPFERAMAEYLARYGLTLTPTTIR